MLHRTMVNEDELVDPPRYPPDDDVQHRLIGTWVQYRNEPALVGHITGNIAVLETPLMQNGWKTVDVHTSSIHFDINATPLGFLNEGVEKPMAYYVRRLPRRRNRQGLYDEAVSLDGLAFGASPHMGLFRACSKQAIAKMLAGVYPSIEEVLSSISSRGYIRSMAFDRRLAIVPDYQNSSDPEKWILYLAYKTNIIGFVERSGVLINATLFEQYQHSDYTNQLVRHNIGVTI